MKPLHYKPTQVALMVRVAAHCGGKSFARRTGETAERIEQMAERKIAPSAAVLRYFELERKAGSYCWQPERGR